MLSTSRVEPHSVEILTAVHNRCTADKRKKLPPPQQQTVDWLVDS